MKSPAQVKILLRRQWENATRREVRLLGIAGAWPLMVAIGRPSPRVIRNDLDRLKRHVEAWRQVTVGQIVWKQVHYRQVAEPVSVPLFWKLEKPSDWIEAIGDTAVRNEFKCLASLVEQVAPLFRSLLIRKLSLWNNKPMIEVAQAARLAMALSPGCASGRPLRTLTMEGIDTKFFERHARLMTALLDLRYEGEASQIGLERFLGALSDSDHWLLVADLQGSLLPFRRIRVRSSELRATALPAKRLLIVENEQCLHHLPSLADTIAVLGAGLDLKWLDAPWLESKQVAYWGDIDTWGLQCLAEARLAVPHLQSLLMNEQVFETFLQQAVAEPVVASANAPEGLTSSEASLYRRLLQKDRGRLEQEFLPVDLVQNCLIEWAS